MKYFLHDTSSFDDEKISELFMEYGFEGLGLFYTILEKIAKQEKPIKTKVLKSQLKVGKRLQKIWSFMESLELISSSNDETFNEQLLNFSQKYQIKNQKTKERVSQWRKNQEDKKNVTHNERVGNASKVKLSKVKESKDNIDSDFDKFWNEYHTVTGKTKTDKEPALKHWDKLTKDEKIKAVEVVPQYAATNEPQYLKKARTYLADKSFNDQFNGQDKRNNGEPKAPIQRTYDTDPLEEIEKLRERNRKARESKA